MSNLHTNNPDSSHNHSRNSAYEQARRYVAAIPGAVSDSGGHNQTFSVACVLVHGFALTESEARDILHEYNQRCVPPWTDKELDHKLKEAAKANHEKPYGHRLSGTPRNPSIAPPSKPHPCATKAAPVFTPDPDAKLPEPIPDGARKLLEVAFKEGEFIRIAAGVPKTDKPSDRPPEAKGMKWMSREGWIRNDPVSVFPPTGGPGFYISVNPMKASGMADADVTAFRHCLIESDTITKAEQWSIYQQSNIPCTAIIDSGGKSIHAWVKIEAKDRTEYDERVKFVYDNLPDLQIDKANKNPSRFSRLPNCTRYDHRQELLAVNVGAASFEDWQQEIESRQQPEPCVEVVDEITTPPSKAAWPKPLKDEAFHGLAGEIVKRIEPHTESDPAALLVSILIMFGNAAGRNAYWLAEDTRHYANEFAVIVGNSSRARKGTSLDRAIEFFRIADPFWTTNCNHSGLVSGEGLIFTVRDPRSDEGGNVEDSGAMDKRALIQESEFARTIAAMGRKENTLSAVLRNSWDGKTLRTLARNGGKGGDIATDPHASIIAHITKTELKFKLAMDDLSNGVANRFLWACAKRSKNLPFGGSLTARDCPDLTDKLHQALAWAKERGHMEFNAAAKELWQLMYTVLNAEGVGTPGEVTSRAPAHVRRLALIYALLDGAQEVDVTHLIPALAVWDYCQESAECIFGGLSKLAQQLDVILASQEGKEFTLSELHANTGRNHTAEAMGNALAELKRFGLATGRKEPTAGAPRELWRKCTN